MQQPTCQLEIVMGYTAPTDSSMPFSADVYKSEEFPNQVNIHLALTRVDGQKERKEHPNSCLWPMAI